MTPSQARKSAPPIGSPSSDPGHTDTSTDNPRPQAMAMVDVGERGAERGHVAGAAAAFERIANDHGRRRPGRDDENERERERYAT